MRAPSQRTAILAASAGNALEFFDFTIFGYFAPQIADAFFPAATHTGALLNAWAAYGTAFLARPAGAIVLGSYADRAGRRAAMTACILLMALGTFMMAVMPGYATIGLAAPAGIFIARLLQGFATGGEFGGATAFMLEQNPSRGGFMASFQFTSQAVANLSGAIAAWLVNVGLSPQALHDWGFRLPFAAGLLIGPVGLYLRRAVRETAVFTASRHARAPVREVLRRFPGRIALVAGCVAAGTSSVYLAIYIPTYAQQTLHFSASDAFSVPVLTGILAIIATPLTGLLADRIGRITPTATANFLLLLAAIPLFRLIDAHPTLPTLLGAMAVITLLRVIGVAATAALFAELFPPGLRAAGMSIGYAAGVTTFGGLAPFINSWAIHATGDRTAPSYYLVLCLLISLASLWRLSRLPPPA